MRQRIITREEKKVVENSVENVLYETYIVLIQVYGYMCTYSLRAYSALHATPAVIKRENVSPLLRGAVLTR